jgi:sugar/nucleoside kinase (ribokinase family)
MGPELIAIGSCTLDCIIQVKDILRFELLERENIKKYTAIEYSRKLNLQNVRFVPGGSGANIAADCSILGLKSAYLGIIGNDFSSLICIDDMKERGVDLSYLKQTDEDSTAFSVILKTEWGKDRSILAYKGANNLLAPEDVKEEYFEDIKAFAWTSLTSDNACRAIEKAINLTKARGGMIFAAPSMSIIANVPDRAKQFISQSDVVSMNHEEAMEFTGEKKKTLMIKHFLNMGVKIISITDGGDGSILSDGKTIINSSVYKGQILDTTGAGDAFLSGLLVSHINNYSLEKATKLASAFASLECRELGVREGLPGSLSELETFVDQNELEQVISTII